MVVGDEFYFISIFQNLLDNAQKYSPNGSEINFYVKENSLKNIICISDQGVGIAEKEKFKIFDRFYRIEDEETRNSKGTGLGLFLVSQIIKIHGGKIYCKDNSPNGTIFEIHLKKNMNNKSALIILDGWVMVLKTILTVFIFLKHHFLTLCTKHPNACLKLLQMLGYQLDRWVIQK